LNCHHTIFPIILGISNPAYTPEELQQINKLSTELIEIDGKQYTRYECSQLCRKLETEMRYAKDQHIIATAAGDDVLKEQANKKLRKLQSKYREVCDNANLTKHYDRAYVPGFRGKQVEPKKIKISAKDTIKPKTINDDLINQIKLKSIWNGCPEEQKEVIINAAKNADHKMLKLALDNMDNCSVIWKGAEDGGGCFHLDGVITMQGTDAYNPMTFWHEYGHFLDKYSGKGYTYHYPNGSTYFVQRVTTIVDETGYKKAAYKDISSMLDKLGLSDKYGVIEGDEVY
jgi:Phage minor capsid protein 2.